MGWCGMEARGWRGVVLGLPGGADALPDPRMGFLRLSRRGGDASANSPDGLVRDDDPRGVEQALDWSQLLLHLRKHCVQALLSDRKRLANTEHARHAGIYDVPVRDRDQERVGGCCAAVGNGGSVGV